MGEIRESEASERARRAAAQLGPIVGSSYSLHADEPVIWAFHIDTGAYHTVLAGTATGPQRILMRTDEEDAFSIMMYAKALTHAELRAHTVVRLPRRISGAEWICDSVYLAHAVLSAEALLAVALHADEIGLNEDDTRELVYERVPDLVSTRDPLAKELRYADWLELVRRLRRVRRLRELSAPQSIIDTDAARAEELLDQLADFPAVLPNDIRNIRL